MGNSDLKVRTKEYALSVIRLFAELPKRTEAQVMGRQALRSGTSVGAQYREASRAKSNADFISKIEGSLQELEETEYWLELLAESGLIPEQRLAALKQETGELKGDIHQHCQQYQGEIQSAKTLICLAFYTFSLRDLHILYPSAFILPDRVAVTTRWY
jgi:four helix bundle protein